MSLFNCGPGCGITTSDGRGHAPGCANAPKEPAAPLCNCGAAAVNAQLPRRESVPHNWSCPGKPAVTPETPKRSLEALKAEVEAMVKNAFADAREKEAWREARARCGMRIEPGIVHSLDGCYSVPKPEAESVDTGCGECTICIRCAIAQQKQMQALRRENEELRRRLQMLESDRSREANPDSRS